MGSATRRLSHARGTSTVRIQAGTRALVSGEARGVVCVTRRIAVADEETPILHPLPANASACHSKLLLLSHRNGQSVYTCPIDRAGSRVPYAHVNARAGPGRGGDASSSASRQPGHPHPAAMHVHGINRTQLRRAPLPLLPGFCVVPPPFICLMAASHGRKRKLFPTPVHVCPLSSSGYGAA